MKRTFIYVENFDQKWKQLGLGAAEQRELEFQLLMDPGQGAVITDTGGLRKMRFSPESENKGKSGDYRIIYLDIQTASHTILLLVYEKNQQAALKPDQKKVLKQFVEQLKSLYTSERMDEK
ncbi:type II toxin-antitoxin system RelE/ParE family toxin [Planococcus beigongshangi]|uniref:type II toxin-antitoxin system RelE/ParE family toxin n=1 Tax=Planococcus beigongshangi TaxID=2782536 RepID=UPI00193BB684|nr:type II toxin-antitoxin system RelE/ParE family toxin [Planococcus beigongshangi]